MLGLGKSIVLSVVLPVQVVVLSQHIRNVYSAEIADCAKDHYLRTHNASWATCLPCSTCPLGYGVNASCTSVSDTVCQPCSPGTYSDVAGGACKTCKRCQPGSYVRTKCNITDDVTCGACIDGYFSDYHDSMICQRCKVCDENEVTNKECSGQNNTQCGDCVRDHFRDHSTMECVPCSQCYGNASVIVRECQEKLGHSQEVCHPLGYIPGVKSDVATSTVEHNTTAYYKTTEDANTNIAIILVSCLSFALITSAILMFGVLTMQHRKPQKAVRIVRDKCFKNVAHRLKKGTTLKHEECHLCCVTPKQPLAEKSETFCAENKLISLTNENKQTCTVNIPSVTDRRLLDEEMVSCTDAESGIDLDLESYDIDCKSSDEPAKKKRRTKRQSTTRYTDYHKPQYITMDTKSEHHSVADSGIELQDNISAISTYAYNSVNRCDINHGHTSVSAAFDDPRLHPGDRIKHKATIENTCTM